MSRAIDRAVDSDELHAAVFGPAVKAAPKFRLVTEDGWAFEEHLKASIDAQSGATFEEKLAALARLPGWEWLDEPMEITPRARKLCEQHLRDKDGYESRSRAKLVRSLRKKLGLIQAEAAERMGIARTTVVAIEQGIRGISLEEFSKLDPSMAVEGGAS